MKNILASFCIFILLISLMLFSINYLNKTCKTFETQSSNLEEITDEEKWDESYDLSLKLLNDWNEKSKTICMFVHHQEIDNINNEIWKLTQYTKLKNKDESMASIHVIKFLLNHINDLEKVNIENIF